MRDALNCGANLNWTTPTATDNSDSVTYTHSDTSGTFFPVGIDTVFHYAFDPSGNTDTCFFVVTVRDTIAPTWDGTLDTLAVFAGADTCGIFTDSLTLTPPTIVEACGLDTLFHSAAAYYALGEYDIYWYATDLSGNTDSILQRLVVTENIKPELYCPSDSITIYADNDSTWTQVSWTGDSIYDNCGVDSAYFNLASGSYLQIGIFKIDYFGYDLSGNGDTCSFFLSVVDTTAPVINLAQGDTTLLADPDSCFASFRMDCANHRRKQYQLFYGLLQQQHPIRQLCLRNYGCCLHGNRRSGLQRQRLLYHYCSRQLRTRFWRKTHH